MDRRVKTVDYLMISHFDSDHSGKTVEIIQNLNVKNIIISKQSETSEQFENTIKAARENKVNIIQVEAGDIIKIEKDIYLEILWPRLDKTIVENALNNNSIVAKMHYGKFSILFTGDIEEIAEKSILETYKNTDILKSVIIKVAHHGSKTSSTEEFIKKVNSKISLIGVGENNKFGHPNDEVVEMLEAYGNKIYRTDLHGEITIKVTKKGKISISTYL